MNNNTHDEHDMVFSVKLNSSKPTIVKSDNPVNRSLSAVSNPEKFE